MESFFDDDKQVVPLITCDDGKYIVCESTLEWLETLGEFGVVACAGKYRTGKSFLLNRLASAPSNVGFGVGDSVQACTKGLWLYKKALEANGKKIVLIDTEGIDALDANDTHDVRIFTLALLLSSAFIYNSVGPIDETALQTLSLMTRVTENVKFDSGEDSSIKDLAPHMPKFYWVLRDFALKLTNKDNDEISQDEYLEQALQSSADPNKNSVREAIRNSFPNRSLVTLPRPSSSVDPSAQRMEDKLMSLSRSFVHGVDNLRERLFNELNIMRAEDSIISGKMYSVLCRHYAEIVQSDSVPVIKDSWSLIASVQARDTKDALIAECIHKLSLMKPKPKDILHEEMSDLKRSILDAFMKKAMKPVDMEVKKSLEETLQQLCENASRRLEINIAEIVSKSMDKVEPMIEKEPEKLSIILNDELATFTEEHEQNSDFVKAWMDAACDRALCRWIPRSLQSLCSDRDDKIEQLRISEEQRSEDSKLFNARNEELVRSQRTKHAELEQAIDSSSHMLSVERVENLRYQTEMIVFTAELRRMENIQSTLQRNEPEITEQINRQALELQDELSNVTIEAASLKAKLANESSNHEKSKRRCIDTNERLEKAMKMQTQLETNLRSGIEKLKQEQEEAYNRQKKEYDDRVSSMTLDLTRIQSQYEKESLLKKELMTEKKRLDDKMQQDTIANEKAIMNLRDLAQTYREQSDQAQNRVLEIHKSMIDDLRIRDERSRDQQSKYLKETADLQSRISDLVSENEEFKTNVSQLKRRISDLDSIEIECKKLKTAERENDIIVTQLRAENAELRTLNAEMQQERESLRKENMSMEGELALLRAEKQLNDARASMTTNK